MVIKMLNTWAGDKADKQLKGEPGVTYALKTNKVFLINISVNTSIFIQIRFILTGQYHSSDILSLHFHTKKLKCHEDPYKYTDYCIYICMIRFIRITF